MALSKAALDGIKSGVRQGLEKAAPDIVGICMDALMNNPAYPVIVGAQVELMKHGVKPREAWDQARDAVAEFLKDEGVKVGHPDYDWTPAGGAEIANSYVIDFFEPQAEA